MSSKSWQKSRRKKLLTGRRFFLQQIYGSEIFENFPGIARIDRIFHGFSGSVLTNIGREWEIWLKLSARKECQKTKRSQKAQKPDYNEKNKTICMDVSVRRIADPERDKPLREQRISPEPRQFSPHKPGFRQPQRFRHTAGKF